MTVVVSVGSVNRKLLIVKENERRVHVIGKKAYVNLCRNKLHARTDAKLKRKAIEAASKEILPQEQATWDNDTNLKEWLKSFNRR